MLSIPKFLLSVSLALVLWTGAVTAGAQSLLPERVGGKMRYTAYIEFPKAYVSGICILLNDGEELRGSVFNEFGISCMDFVWKKAKDKVKLLSVQKMLNKWYIRQTLRKDLRLLLHQMAEGRTAYVNEKRHITYQLKPITTEQEEEIDDETER